MRKPILLLILGLTSISLLSCNQRPKRIAMSEANGGGGGSGNSGPKVPAPQETGDMAPTAPGLDLVWKRYRAFEHGLVQGLELKKADFCLELGRDACVDKTHLTVLGGNEPYKAGQYERAQKPTVLTAVAVDRIVLSACSNRLELDRKAMATALVFKHFPLSGSTRSSAQLEAQAKELYQRILARNPEESEVKAISGLASEGMSNDKLALMLCFAIASSSENILL